MRALIVDDSRFVRDHLSVLLARRGYDCVAAENGQAGLACLGRSGPYDVALIDWSMPVMDGLQMIKEVRRNRKLDRLKILMVTAQAENSHIEAALIAGADEYLMKPLNEPALVEKLGLVGLMS